MKKSLKCTLLTVFVLLAVLASTVPLSSCSATEKLYLFSKDIQAHQIITSAITGSSDISKFESEGGAAKLNRYIGTKHLEISDSYEIILVQTPQFKDMTYIYNGVEQENWYNGAEK